MPLINMGDEVKHEEKSVGLDTIKDYHVLALKRDLPFDTPQVVVESIIKIDDTIRFLREYRKLMESEAIAQMEDGAGVVVGDKKYFVGKKKKDRFDSERLIALLRSDEYREQVIAALPKNPDFKKKAVLQIQEKLGEMLHHEEIEDKLEFKEIPLELLPGGKNGAR